MKILKLLNWLTQSLELNLEDDGFKRCSSEPFASLRFEAITIVYVNSTMYKNQLLGCIHDRTIYLKRKNDLVLWALSIDSLVSNRETFRPWILKDFGTKLSFGGLDDKVRRLTEGQ